VMFIESRSGKLEIRTVPFKRIILNLGNGTDLRDAYRVPFRQAGNQNRSFQKDILCLGNGTDLHDAYKVPFR